MSLEALKKDVISAVDAMRDELLALSHTIHGEPELALEEFKAAARLTKAVETPRHRRAARGVRPQDRLCRRVRQGQRPDHRDPLRI